MSHKTVVNTLLTLLIAAPVMTASLTAYAEEAINNANDETTETTQPASEAVSSTLSTLLADNDATSDEKDNEVKPEAAFNSVDVILAEGEKSDEKTEAPTTES